MMLADTPAPSAVSPEPARPGSAASGPGASWEFQELIDSLDDVVFRFDDAGRWSYLSPAWQKRLGWDAAGSLGCRAARFLHPSDRSVALHHWGEVLAGRARSFRGEVRFREKSGGYRWMLVSARGRWDASGALRGVSGTLTDVSAAKAVEADLIAARAAAEVASKSKSEFLSTMSHELRTPLNAVIGLSESLLEGGTAIDPTRVRRYLGLIHDSGKQLLAQINDILDVARIEAGRIQVNASAVELGHLCGSVVELAQKEARSKQLSVALRRADTTLMVQVDERLMRQVVQNLVNNALKFTPAHGSIHVAVERAPSGQFVIAVRDTGIGIAPEKLDRLFKPFSQVDSSIARPYGGTGLGLVLVDRIVRLHHGTVEVQSAPGQGSTFTVVLPASVASPVLARDASAPARERSVLLVDDDPRQHALIGDYLRDRGFEVIHCDNGQTALQVVARREPGVAIIDVNMPGMSGIECIEKMRQSAHGRGVPIIAATALAETDAAARCRAAGANVHLAKPVSLQVLAFNLRQLTGLAA